jgi:arylsulfatase A-like enzyme
MKEQHLWTTACVFVLTCMLAIHSGKSQHIAERPNIIFILSDDLGYGDLGCFGQKKIQTPNIDRIASEGIRFTNAYAGSAVCAPSRCTLMQGLHTGHARIRDNSIDGYRESLREGDLTVAMFLKEAGYTNGLFGKWGLALHNQDGVPGNMGFHEFFGYLNQAQAHNYYPEFLWENETRVYFPENGTHHTSIEMYKGDQPYDEQGICHPLGIDDPAKATYSMDICSERSLDFIRKNKDGPFFVYLAYTPPHAAFIVPELGVYNDTDWPLSHKIYAAMITRMDSEVGKVLDLLSELGIDGNTLIFFASDNGNIRGNAKPGDTSTNEFFNNLSPTRGGKRNNFNGAFHVPAVARWPRYIAPGQVNDHVWAFWDFFPTVADILGVEPPKGLDGVSILPVLLGQEERTDQRMLYWEYKQNQSVRYGDFFAIKPSGGAVSLYDLLSDPQQSVDLSSQFPEMTQKLKDYMESQHTPSDVWPSPGETKEAFVQRLQEAGAPERLPNAWEY